MTIELPPKLDKAKKEGELLVRTVRAIDKAKKPMVKLTIGVLIILAIIMFIDLT